MTTDGAGHWQHKKRRRLWLGILPNDVRDEYEVKGWIARMTRIMNINLEHYNIEIEAKPGLLDGGRTVFAVRRPVEDVETNLL